MWRGCSADGCDVLLLSVKSSVVLSVARHRDSRVDELRKGAHHGLASKSSGVGHCFAETVLCLLHVVDPWLLCFVHIIDPCLFGGDLTNNVRTCVRIQLLLIQLLNRYFSTACGWSALKLKVATWGHLVQSTSAASRVVRIVAVLATILTMVWVRLLVHLCGLEGHPCVKHLVEHTILEHHVEHLGLVLLPFITVLVCTFKSLFHLLHELLRVYVVHWCLLLVVIRRIGIGLRQVRLLVIWWDEGGSVKMLQRLLWGSRKRLFWANKHSWGRIETFVDMRVVSRGCRGQLSHVCRSIVRRSLFVPPWKLGLGHFEINFDLFVCAWYLATFKLS